MSRITDEERAKLLGMSLNEFQALIGEEKLLEEEKRIRVSQDIHSTHPFNPAAPVPPLEPATSSAPAPLVSRGEITVSLQENDTEFSLTLIDPSNFASDELKIRDIDDGVSIVVAKRSKEEKVETQSYKFTKKKFNAVSAGQWIKKNLTKKSKAHVNYVEDLYKKMGTTNVVYLRRDYTDQPLHIKPRSNYWDSVPETADEKALYMGFHVHSADNPFGLHTHVPGGKITGAHLHGPQNRSGMHTHAEFDSALLGVDVRIGVIQLDGNHVHLHNHIDGGHTHCPEAFG